MKLPLIKHLLLLLVTAVLLSSCGDDDEGNGGGNPVVNNTPYLPGTSGSIWVYSNQSIGSDGTVTNIPAQDTLTITKENSTVLGRTANEVTHNFVYPFGEGVQNTANYAIAQDGSKLSVSSSFMNLLIPELAQNVIKITPDSWLLMTDGNAGVGTSWTVDSVNIAGVTLEIAPITFDAGASKLTISRQKDTTVDNKPCHHYKLSISYQGSMSTTIPGLKEVLALASANTGGVRTVFAEISFFWAPELGLQKLSAPSQNAYVESVQPLPPPFANYKYQITEFTLPGFSKTLVYNNINK